MRQMEEKIRVYVLGPREDGFYSPLIKKKKKKMKRDVIV